MDDQYDQKTMPNQFLCPIFQQIMKDPVLTVDGFSFQRRAIQEWFNKGKNTNPVTNKSLPSTTLTQNRALRHVIQHHNTRLRQIQRQAQLNAKKLAKQQNQRIAIMYPELVNQLGTIDLDKFTIFSNEASNLRSVLKNISQKFADLRKCCERESNYCKECRNLLQNIKGFKQFFANTVEQTLKMQPMIQVKEVLPETIYYLIFNTEVIKAIDFRRLKKDDLKKREIKGIMLSYLSMQELISKIRKQAKIPEKDFVRIWITDESEQKLYNQISQQVETITGSYLCKVKRVGKKVENWKQKVEKLGIKNNYYIIFEHGPGEEYVFRDQDAKCDYCYKFKKIQAICDCKRVFYCSQQCKTKDKSYHENVCKLNQRPAN